MKRLQVQFLLGAPCSKIFFLALSKVYRPRIFGLAGLLAVAVEEGEVDETAFVRVLKLDDVGFVEENGIEDDRAVLVVRASYIGMAPFCCEKACILGLFSTLLYSAKSR